MVYDFYTAPPTYSAYTGKLKEIKRDFPFLQMCTIGQSVLGRPIPAVSVGAQSPCVLFAGAFHAQEWLTCSLLVRFLEHISLSLSQHTALAGSMVTNTLMNRGLVLVPMVNPDGVSIALEGAESAGALCSSVKRIQSKSSAIWQANARGVDLNHNFDAGFNLLKKAEEEHGLFAPAPRQYGGAYPHSEPESAALVRFLRGRRVERVYAFHSQGEEIYGEYGAWTPAESRYLLRLLSCASGYTPVQNDGLCSHGGFKDYFIKKYSRPGFTVEIGSGENPLPIHDLEEIYDRLLEMMVIATIL